MNTQKNNPWQEIEKAREELRGQRMAFGIDPGITGATLAAILDKEGAFVRIVDLNPYSPPKPPRSLRLIRRENKTNQ